MSPAPDTIAPATTAEEIQTARQLFREYSAELGVDLCFQGFARELETLPGAYAPPGGALLLARVAESPAGCVAMRPRGDDLCEMKRLFVRSPFRRCGLGRALVREIIAAAERAGYGKMVLDTLDWMKPAMALYESFGFQRGAAYYENPLPGVVYFERKLEPRLAGVCCREFAFGSEDYQASVRLREAVLRRPLGLSWEPGAFAGEEASFHLGAFVGARLVGSLVLLPLDSDTLKMRQVAVTPEAQGRGVGTVLVEFAEQFALARGFRTIVAHARETALRFYRAHGYSVVGEAFLELGIPHFRICKVMISEPEPA